MIARGRSIASRRAGDTLRQSLHALRVRLCAAVVAAALGACASAPPSEPAQPDFDDEPIVAPSAQPMV
jgi:hypothetical protein